MMRGKSVVPLISMALQWGWFIITAKILLVDNALFKYTRFFYWHHVCMSSSFRLLEHGVETVLFATLDSSENACQRRLMQALSIAWGRTCVVWKNNLTFFDCGSGWAKIVWYIPPAKHVRHLCWFAGDFCLTTMLQGKYYSLRINWSLDGGRAAVWHLWKGQSWSCSFLLTYLNLLRLWTDIEEEIGNAILSWCVKMVHGTIANAQTYKNDALYLTISQTSRLATSMR